MNRRKFSRAILCLLLVMLPLFWHQGTIVASAATTAFTNNSIRFHKTGDTYQLKIKNWVAGSRYQWFSKNGKVAVISQNGVATSMGEGKTSIQCKITYPKGNTRIISCKVTVALDAKTKDKVAVSAKAKDKAVVAAKHKDKSADSAKHNDKTVVAAKHNNKSAVTTKDKAKKVVLAKHQDKKAIPAKHKGKKVVPTRHKGKKVVPTKHKAKKVVPATKIQITNAVKQNGAHVMKVGESYTFGSSMLPANTSYKAYWFTGSEGDLSCISIANAYTGRIIAKKPGMATLVVAAAKTSTQKAAARSKVKDTVIIEVVENPASVKSVQIVNSNEIKVEFDCAIDKNTVIGANGELSNSIGISLRKNAKGVIATDPGKLTAALSSDFKTLTITAGDQFSGNYGIEFTNQIKTVDGVALKEYYKQISYTDNVCPSITNVALDDSGVLNVITFSEAMDFSKLKVSDAALVRNSKATTNDASTIAILNNALNYTASVDKKSLTINLSTISSNDFNKTFSVAISGVKDLAGNYPQNYTLTVQLRTDTTPKPQAVPYNVERSAYHTLTAYFTRAIRSAGTAAINNGALIYGQVDKNDNKKVNYTLSKNEEGFSGNAEVVLCNWDSYHVLSTDGSARQGKKFNVNFTPDRTNPVLLSYDYDSKASVLTLTYNEKVDLDKNNGILSTTLMTTTDDIRPGTNVTYTKMDSTDPKVLKLKLSNTAVLGKYTIVLDQGFVLDAFSNGCDKKTITIQNMSGRSTELPAPYSVKQLSADLSQIQVDFSNKLDVASAQMISNYTIPGVTITSAQVIKNTQDNGATVLLTVADGTITASVDRPITISGIKGYGGSYSAMSAYTAMIALKENKKAYYVAPLVFGKNDGDRITINFSEEIEGSLTLKVIQTKGSMNKEINNTVTVSGTRAYINLREIPEWNSYLKISVVKNALRDKSGNMVMMPDTLGVTVNY